jgi:hypothetical protein
MDYGLVTELEELSARGLLDQAGPAADEVWGRERGVRFGGTEGVAEFSSAGLGARLGVSS